MAKKAEKSLVVGLDIGTSKIVAIVGELQIDGSVEVIPTSVKVLPFIGRIPLTDDDLTTDQSSDHWSVYGQFKLVMRS